MKLEAVDKKSTSMTCVATVVDTLGDRVLVHFDGWEDIYDYWADLTSPYIHPVGWCQENGKPISPPNGNKRTLINIYFFMVLFLIYSFIYMTCPDSLAAVCVIDVYIIAK